MYARILVPTYMAMLFSFKESNNRKIISMQKVERAGLTFRNRVLFDLKLTRKMLDVFHLTAISWSVYTKSKGNKNAREN